MGLFNTDPADADRRTAEKTAARELKEQRRVEEKARLAAEAFADSPVGRARASFRRGDPLFQISLGIQEMESYVVAGATPHMETFTNDDLLGQLNEIVREGWELRVMSTAFVTEGQETRHRLLAAGQQVAVRGILVGTYVFACDRIA